MKGVFGCFFPSINVSLKTTYSTPVEPPKVEASAYAKSMLVQSISFTRKLEEKHPVSN